MSFTFERDSMQFVCDHLKQPVATIVNACFFCKHAHQNIHNTNTMHTDTYIRIQAIHFNAAYDILHMHIGYLLTEIYIIGT